VVLFDVSSVALSSEISFNVQWVSKTRRGGVLVTYCGLGKIVLNIDSLCFIVIRVKQDRLNTQQWMYAGV
jgi:type IV secretory pathway TrbF-like protein